ncbi:hypothetical protein [Polymorphum gilvum]|uniref:PepSY domain-containing protein n=1 Tax=Polymorphum gilvum (strain LMG 25793 / CGMCC 1.9160 / SL003B-26A1) TaxID=991905 RepID=F2IXX4_POLGS|nr:hypothetical protein [Polymorphum gilvum]ADZ69455.1 hypothetical protein SL003B_1026 [Polymorphum gilvum SL003B-26A1]
MLRAFALSATFAVGLAAPAFADDPTPEAVEKINALLASMNCEIDEDDIEMEDGGYDLDDVQCADGQYDMKLNANFEVTDRRKE